MILDTLVAATKKRVAAQKVLLPPEELRSQAEAGITENRKNCKPDDAFRFEKALALNEISFICEIKKASPSKGLIAPDFMYMQIAKDYEKAGADCVLLICAILQESELKEYLALCDSLGLSALVETHDEREIEMAVRAGARILGVNNRNLKTFEVDLSVSRRLRELVPKEILFVAESGIQTAQDIRLLRQANVNAVLIGETLMRSADKKAMLDMLRGTKQ